ncbi:MAG: hypothetical protein ACR2JY_08385 [Chloroflexota bacterium]
MHWWARDRRLTADCLAPRLIARPRWHPPVGNRACNVHPFLRATDRCDRCGQPFCATCMQHVERWRICRDCLTWLIQERTGPTAPVRQDRWRQARPSLLAALAIGLVLTATITLATGVLGQADSTSTVAGAAQRSGCLEQYPDRGRLYVLAGVSLSESVPATIELRNCGFQPGERFQVEARIDGARRDYHGVRNLLVGSVTGQADQEGAVHATVTIPSHDTFIYPGAFDLHLRASGEQGSVASRDIHGGEIVVPFATVGPCPPAPQPCPPGYGRPASSPD